MKTPNAWVIVNKFLMFFVFLYSYSGFCAYPTFYLDLPADVNTNGAQRTVTIPRTMNLYEVVIQVRFNGNTNFYTFTDRGFYRYVAYAERPLYVFLQYKITEQNMANAFPVSAVMYRIEFSKNPDLRQSLKTYEYKNFTSYIFWTGLLNDREHVQATCSVALTDSEYRLTFNLPRDTPYTDGDISNLDTYTASSN